MIRSPCLVPQQNSVFLTLFQDFLAAHSDPEGGSRLHRLYAEEAPVALEGRLLKKGEAKDKKRLHHFQTLIQSLAKVESFSWLEANATPPQAATALVGTLELLIPMAGLIDVKEESARLNKELAKLAKEIERAETKLQNPQFADKAPVDVVAKEREKLADLKTTQQKLTTQLHQLTIKA